MRGPAGPARQEGPRDQRWSISITASQWQCVLSRKAALDATGFGKPQVPIDSDIRKRYLTPPADAEHCKLSADQVPASAEGSLAADYAGSDQPVLEHQHRRAGPEGEGDAEPVLHQSAALR